MTQSELHQNIEVLRSQINHLVAALASYEEASVTQLKDNSVDVDKQSKATLASVKIAELEYQINSLYQPQIDTMQDQIAALMTQVEQLMKQAKVKNA